MHTRYVEDSFDDCLYDYIVYTDGGYSRKNDIGAFAFVLLDGKKENIILSKSWKIEHESNNRAEMKAILASLHLMPSDAKKVCIVSDSQYALKTFSGIFNGTANADLQDWYRKWMSVHEVDITFKWVRGHSGDQWNEMCDTMCNDAVGFDLNEEYERYRKHK